MIEQSVQIAFKDDKVSVRHLVCCDTLLSGRFTRLTLLRVVVNHDSTLEPSTTLGDARGAKAAADAGNRAVGIMTRFANDR